MRGPEKSAKVGLALKGICGYTGSRAFVDATQKRHNRKIFFYWFQKSLQVS